MSNKFSNDNLSVFKDGYALNENASNIELFSLLFLDVKNGFSFKRDQLDLLNIVNKKYNHIDAFEISRLMKYVMF